MSEAPVQSKLSAIVPVNARGPCISMTLKNLFKIIFKEDKAAIKFLKVRGMLQKIKYNIHRFDSAAC